MGRGRSSTVSGGGPLTTHDTARSAARPYAPVTSAPSTDTTGRTSSGNTTRFTRFALEMMTVQARVSDSLKIVKTTMPQNTMTAKNGTGALGGASGQRAWNTCVSTKVKMTSIASGWTKDQSPPRSEPRCRWARSRATSWLMRSRRRQPTRHGKVRAPTPRPSCKAAALYHTGGDGKGDDGAKPLAALAIRYPDRPVLLTRQRRRGGPTCIMAKASSSPHEVFLSGPLEPEEVELGPISPNRSDVGPRLGRLACEPL